MTAITTAFWRLWVNSASRTFIGSAPKIDEMDGGGSDEAAQRRPGQSPAGHDLARTNHHAVGLDGATIGDAQPRVSCMAAASGRQGSRHDNAINRPVFEHTNLLV